MAIDYTQLVSAIATGKLDSNLPELSDLIRERRERTAKKLAYTLQAKDIVVLCNLRSKSVNGQRAQVIQVNRTTVTVKLDRDRDKPFAPATRVPLICCQLVKSE